jgi:hypothetical protein
VRLWKCDELKTENEKEKKHQTWGRFRVNHPSDEKFLVHENSM